AQYVITGEARNEIGRRPDMVEPTPPVGCLPVTRAIAPPGVELLFVGDVEAHEVDPACRLAHCLEALRLDGRVADDSEQLLVRPDIMFECCDAEVAHQDRGCGSVMLGTHLVQCGNEIEFVLELPVDYRIRLVAPCGYVEIV